MHVLSSGDSFDPQDPETPTSGAYGAGADTAKTFNPPAGLCKKGP
jgi:hypothetical protein